jgi:hypothetical protein
MNFSILPKLFLAFVFSFGLFQHDVASQSCNSCPVSNINNYKVSGTKNLSSFVSVPGNSRNVNACWLFDAGAVLNIDVNVTFSNCKFWLGNGAKIVANTNCGFSNTSTIGACAPNAIGLQISSGITVTANSTSIGVLTLGSGLLTGIVGNSGSTLNSTSALTIANCTTGIQSSGSTVNVTGSSITAVTNGVVSTGNSTIKLQTTTVTAAQSGVTCTAGRPSIEVTLNSNITGTAYRGISCVYSSGVQLPTLKIQNSTVKAGNGILAANSNQRAAIYLDNTLGSATGFTGVPEISGNVSGGGVSTDIASAAMYILKISNMQISGNTVNVKCNINSGSVSTYGVDYRNASNLSFTNNTLNYTGVTSGTRYGLAITDAPSSIIDGNVFNNFRTRQVSISGNCLSDGTFNGNRFIGGYLTGLYVDYSSSLGTQFCHTNRWETAPIAPGTGIQAGTGANCFFSANPSSNIVYRPTVSPAAILALDPSCDVLSLKEDSPSTFLMGGLPQNDDQIPAQDYRQIAKVFPNPASDKFEVLLPDFQADNGYEILLSDVSGQIIQRSIVEPQVLQAELLIDGLKPGSYLVQILSKDFRQVEKLMIIR